MPETPAPIFPLPRLRIHATYAATDGSRPESIYIEFGDDTQVTAQLLTEVICALAGVGDGQVSLATDQPASTRQQK